MKRSWLIFYHSICANDFSCINARGVRGTNTLIIHEFPQVNILVR